jgi:hypothetical protein
MSVEPVIWTDVRGRLLHPVLAHNTQSGTREVEARLWHTPDDPEQVYKLTFRLVAIGADVDIWVRKYAQGDKTINSAHAAYFDWQRRAERWLQGESLSVVRPRMNR